MIDLIFYALSLGGTDATAAAQQRIDELVRRCDAGHVVKLSARDGNDVAMNMLILMRAPTNAESRKFECVLKGMKKMPDLHFGFIGNAAEPDGS